MISNPNYYCRQIAAQSGSSFYYSLLFLKPEQKQALQTIYAFCRKIDDIVDECSDLNLAAIQLNWWREEIKRTFAGIPEHPIGYALVSVLKHYSLKESIFLDIILGMEMDLYFKGYQTFSELENYCEKVASNVGFLLIEIFGYQDPITLRYARLLGISFQLVNIIRDIGDDLRRGRLYIPEEECKLFSFTENDFYNKKYNENFRALMAFQANRAREYFEQAKALLPAPEYQNQKSSLMMANIYFALLEEIEKTGFQVMHQKISLTPIRKLWIAWKTHRKIKKMVIK